MPQPAIPLLPSQTYHIYSHAIGNECFFRQEENYHYFLKKYSEHIHPVAKTYAYCLMPNHFHLMVSVRDEECLLELFSLKQTFTAIETLSDRISKKFGNFFNAYAKAYNERFDRRGALFERPFKRKLVETDHYFTTLMAYIHNNPIHHRFVKDLNDWPHSSWHSYLLNKPTKISRNEGLEWFGGREEFVKFHREVETKDVVPEFEFT